MRGKRKKYRGHSNFRRKSRRDFEGKEGGEPGEGKRGEAAGHTKLGKFRRLGGKRRGRGEIRGGGGGCPSSVFPLPV